MERLAGLTLMLSLQLEGLEGLDCSGTVALH